MGRDDYNGKPSCPTIPTNSISYRSHQTNIPPLPLGQNVEMASLTQNGSQFGRQGDPNAILNELRDIDNSITEINGLVKELQMLQDKSLGAVDNTALLKDIADKGGEAIQAYRALAERLMSIKQKPESGSPRNAPQLGKVDRRLKKAVQDYREVDADFGQKSRSARERQFRIAYPEADDRQVREAGEAENDGQVFRMAMMTGNRRGQAVNVEAAVRERSKAIQAIATQMAELAQLFQDMENLVVQQEAAVVNIEQKGEEVVENMDKGTEQIGVAIKSARNRNKLKWWCLGITSAFPFAILLFTYSTNRYLSQS
jgi:syntaxin 1B/2/3